MDFRQLRYFVAVADLCSFTKASAQLHIAQPALSRHVGNLEAELKVRLLRRSARRVTTTPEGRLLLDKARFLLKSLEATRVEIEAFGQSAAGPVTLGVTPTVSRLLVAPLVQTCRYSHPNITIKIVEAFDSADLEESIEQRTIDLAVQYIHEQSRRFSYVPMLSEELLVMGNPDNIRAIAPDGTLPLQTLRELPLILPSRPHGLRLYLDRTLGVRLNVVSEANAIRPLIELAKAGIGFTILPHSAAPWEIEYGILNFRKLKQPGLARRVGLVWSAERIPNPAERALARLILDETHRLVEMNHWKGKLVRPLPRESSRDLLGE